MTGLDIGDVFMPELVAEVGNWDYSWDVVGCFYDPIHNAFRVARDAGCSCNAPWDDFYVPDHYGPPLSLAQAVLRFREYARAYGYGSLDSCDGAIVKMIAFANEKGIRRA